MLVKVEGNKPVSNISKLAVKGIRSMSTDLDDKECFGSFSICGQQHRTRVFRMQPTVTSFTDSFTMLFVFSAFSYFRQLMSECSMFIGIHKIDPLTGNDSLDSYKSLVIPSAFSGKQDIISETVQASDGKTLMSSVSLRLLELTVSVPFRP